MEKFDKKKSIFTYDGKYTYEYFVEGCKTYPTALFWGQIIFIFLILFGINTISALLGNSPVRIYFLENFILLLFLIFVRLLAFNKIIRNNSLKELEKIDNKSYNIYFYDDHFIFESEKSIIINKYSDITKIVESDKYIYIIASNRIFSLKKELISNELYEYIINLNKEAYKRKGKINYQIRVMHRAVWVRNRAAITRIPLFVCCFPSPREPSNCITPSPGRICRRIRNLPIRRSKMPFISTATTISVLLLTIAIW